jgi:integrator complex subunit 11
MHAQVCEGVEVTPYYAGHVLGAAMLHVRAGSESLVYTGEREGCAGLPAQ